MKKDSLLLTIRKFLESRFEAGRPVLLGYSGGPDSKALLYLLHACIPQNLILAHVNHGWRQESLEEAHLIAKEAAQLGLPLFTQHLDCKDFKAGNLEEQGRDHRLKFFAQIYQQLGCQALVLGHHLDDQAEVVLKRVFEGASLFHLKGLEQDTQLLQMRLWRPLLATSKVGVLGWLDQKKISYFLDPTNSSAEFLRGRMREEMVPFLKASFGKEISSNLSHLAEESRQLKFYFEELNTQLIEAIQDEERGSCLNLNPFLPLPFLQIKYLLIEWMRKENVTFSRPIFEGVAKALIHRLPKKKFLSNQGEFLVHNGVVWFYKCII